MGKLKLTTVVGARPQFVKAGTVSRAIRDHFSDQVEEDIIHTGQHYDYGMSDVFFEELDIPAPAAHLGIGSMGHGAQTGEMMRALEEDFLSRKPDAVMVYGDTNSTMAAALAAVKIHIPVIHVEAGLRSFNMRMPEEVNRICTDHVSSMYSCPTQQAIDNLKLEGIVDTEGTCSPANRWVKHHGDVMFDNMLYLQQKFGGCEELMEKNGLESGKFIMMTCHRPSNSDNKESLTMILDSLRSIAQDNGLKVFFPMHPRTRKMAETNLDPAFWSSLQDDENFILHEPVGIVEVTGLLNECRMVATDSGGLQKEALFADKPVIILRNETEWVEIVKSGWGKLTGSDSTKIKTAFSDLSGLTGKPPRLYGDGRAAELLIGDIINGFGA